MGIDMIKRFFQRQKYYVRVASDYITIVHNDVIVLKESSTLSKKYIRQEKVSKALHIDVITDFYAAEQMISHFFRKIIRSKFLKPDIIVSHPAVCPVIELRAMRDIFHSIANSVTIILEPLAAYAYLSQKYTFEKAIIINCGAECVKVDCVCNSQIVGVKEILFPYSSFYSEMTVSETDKLVEEIIPTINKYIGEYGEDKLFLIGGEEDSPEKLQQIAGKLPYKCIIPEDYSNIIVRGLKIAHENPIYHRFSPKYIL